MIHDWRRKWSLSSQAESNFPFGFVQIAQDVTSDGVPIRWHQTADLGQAPNAILDNVFMAVSLDTYDPGHGIHPRNKQIVAQRLACSGMRVAYGNPDFPANGPFPREIDVSDESVLVRYDQEFTFDADETTGFQICCSDPFRDGVDVCLPTKRSEIEINISKRSIEVGAKRACGGRPRFLAYLWRDVNVLESENLPIYGTDHCSLPAAPWIKKLS